MAQIANAPPALATAGRLLRAVDSANLRAPRGRVIGVSGGVIKAQLAQAKIGALCRLRTPGDELTLSAEVIGLSDGCALLLPFGSAAGVCAATEVSIADAAHRIGVGPALLGRVLDGLGQPLDGLEAPHCEQLYAVDTAPPALLQRRPIDAPLALGVRSVDALLSCGEGARFGVFAPAGGGKSTLLAMAVRQARVDVVVVGLIGERGREVREFIDDALGADGLKRSVVVAAPADRPALERVKAASVATAIAEYFRDQGLRVLLLIDSITRYARALREIGLAAGEAPTRNGFPASVFAALPRLLERAGQSECGSISSLYSVLVEGDDLTEPVADETRSLLDGHIVLSRRLAEAGRFPALDVLASASRVMDKVVSSEQRADAARVRQLLARYEEIELLLRVGEYQTGGDPLADEAISKRTQIEALLRQRSDEPADFAQTVARLRAIVA